MVGPEVRKSVFVFVAGEVLVGNVFSREAGEGYLVQVFLIVAERSLFGAEVYRTEDYIKSPLFIFRFMDGW